MDVVRAAAPAELAQMADIVSKGFLDDDVCGRFMHPKRREFPNDWYFFWVKEIRTRLVDPAHLIFVRPDAASGKVAAFCVMKRIGEGGDKRVTSESLAQKCRRLIVEAQNLWCTWTWTDRSADPDAIAKFDNNWDDIAHHFTGPRKECWMIDTLCVHPEFQKKGFGRDLTLNAIEVCRSEEPMVPLAVIASETGNAFYEKQGFQEAGRANVGDLSGAKGGSIKFYERHLRN
jgi:GNAT superfamily N-acetyltransferase